MRETVGAWEALFRAQSVLAREFTTENIWGELSPYEYDVLYTLSRCPAEGLRLTEINQQVLLTQSGISRITARLCDRGLLARRPDPDDARAQRIALTDTGREVQRAVGRRHARQIERAMNRALDADQLEVLRRLCTALTEAAENAPTDATEPTAEVPGDTAP
ncbi:MarR family winged helix-turn-helix transcriptional regulator [Streptomyces sp. NPDC051561]|uniref:MarR family winged helix-turn-helix transcriptional regulator n=1 Tax=Streptomyces sp. NPDC051561 TaxID=3365658 RepID=UPI0037989734